MEVATDYGNEKQAQKRCRNKPKSDEDIRVENFIKENDLTLKKRIVWMKDVTYVTPTIKWHEEKHPDVIELESPLDLFQKYFTENLFQLTADNTNVYAVQKKAKLLPTTAEEIKTFVGRHIVMGNCHYQRINCYWQPQLNIPIISNSMAINTFIL